jgi:hypothetical protein
VSPVGGIGSGDGRNRLNNSGIVHHRINPPETVQRFVNGVTAGIVLGDIRPAYQGLTTQTSNLIAGFVKILFRSGDQRDCRRCFAQPASHGRPDPAGGTGYDDYSSVIHGSSLVPYWVVSDSMLSKN